MNLDFELIKNMLSELPVNLFLKIHSADTYLHHITGDTLTVLMMNPGQFTAKQTLMSEKTRQMQ